MPIESQDSLVEKRILSMFQTRVAQALLEQTQVQAGGMPCLRRGDLVTFHLEACWRWIRVFSALDWKALKSQVLRRRDVRNLGLVATEMAGDGGLWNSPCMMHLGKPEVNIISRRSRHDAAPLHVAAWTGAKAGVSQC